RPLDRYAAARGLARCPVSPRPRPLRAVPECAPGTHRAPVAEPLFLLPAGARTPLDCPALCRDESGASRLGRGRRELPLVERPGAWEGAGSRAGGGRIG